jgi:REP element-mobilizing transposase RayT
MSAAGPLSGSARVSHAGDSVAPSRTFTEAQAGNGAHYYRRRLPHFERPWAIYAVTICTDKGRCLSPRARTIVLNSLRHFHNQRHELFAAFMMPDHAHLLPQPSPKDNDDNGNGLFWPLSELMHSIKSFSAHRINELERKRGPDWQKEQFDRYVRSDRDLQEKFHYIFRNPWDSGGWQSRIKITRGSGRRMMNGARKVCFGATPKPARATRALPRSANHD